MKENEALQQLVGFLLSGGDDGIGDCCVFHVQYADTTIETVTDTLLDTIMAVRDMPTPTKQMALAMYELLALAQRYRQNLGPPFQEIYNVRRG
jgi:hypothetical protein